jgi:predicted phosphodiesterase
LGPRLAFSGHVHEPQSWRAKVARTWSLNPGYEEGPDRPRHIVIDMTVDRATWRGPNAAEDLVLLRK